MMSLLLIVICLSMSHMVSANTATQKLQKSETQVIRLIDCLTEAKQQPIAIKQLEKMGEPIVVLIIKHMDNRKSLGSKYVEFENKATNTFERYRIYKPEQVVDILAGLLNQMTGESFGDIYSGGHDFQRDEVIFMWREWCTNLPKTKPSDCGAKLKVKSRFDPPTESQKTAP